MEVLREGYRIPFLRPPPLSPVPIPLPSYSPSSTKGVALRDCTLSLVAKGAVELAPLPSPGFYSRLFVVWKTSGSWRPVIDLSILNRFVDVSHFQMETIQSVLLSVRQGDWMASIDLREAYLQVPVHPESRQYLRFVALGRVFQFQALCFGLSTAPQVFTWVMAPVSAILHSMGIRMRRYLDDWLVQSSFRKSLLRDLQVVLALCRELGIVVNPEKSNLVPFQVVQYLGVVINAQSFMASPLPERVSRLFSTVGEFQSSASPPAGVWLSLIGILFSLTHFVPGGRLRIRSLQLCLHRSWVAATSRPLWLGLRPTFATSSGGFTSRVLPPGSPFVRCPPIWTFGLMRQPWVGGPIWALSSLQAFGIWRRRSSRPTPGSCWPSVAVSSISSRLCAAGQSQCSATTSLWWRISARRGAPDLPC